MMALRDPATGEVVLGDPDLYPGWQELPPLPPGGPDRWRWVQAGESGGWQAVAPSLPVEQLWQLLTIEQHTAVRVLAATVPLMAVAMDRINARREPLPLNDGNFIAFVMMAQQGGALTMAEAARVLAGQMPQAA